VDSFVDKATSLIPFSKKKEENRTLALIAEKAFETKYLFVVGTLGTSPEVKINKMPQDVSSFFLDEKTQPATTPFVAAAHSLAESLFHQIENLEYSFTQESNTLLDVLKEKRFLDPEQLYEVSPE
jgi:hypothetical protein